MDLVIFNAILYVGASLLYWSIRRKIDAGFVLLSVYAAIAIACVFNYAASPWEWDLQLWPFLYLFAISMLFFRPYFFDSDLIRKKLLVTNQQVLIYFANFYIICSLMAIYYLLPQAIENIRSGEWSVLRNELYQDGIQLYSSQVERIAMILVSYLKPLAIILLFFFLTLYKKRPVWLIILAISITLPVFLTAINVASRGMLVSFAITSFLGYIIFRREISKTIRKIVGVFAGVLLVFFLIYSLAVTASRFGQDDQTSSLIYYFGHSMLTFNYGIADSIHSYLNGEHFFGWFYDKLGLAHYGGIKHSELGTHFGTAFFTFVGAWYLDFGPFGTFLIALFLPMAMISIFRYKRVLDIADVYIYLFYLDYLVMGVFVYGRGYGLAWFIAFMVYGFLKILK
ncbi:O-antigen polymerase [Gaoshiqia sediminis]|uniref:Oligosaccharide repeat unit polymerase n=1 Tax=Gaoshiqia sediminis TaxID=2986998 RepID=A0AA42CB44_9BACT|nr:O-antigen polymerase [Gaoshiqia sediminis]MCW0484742.1 oligosaccharide repeat unit polymerase [Gaoshiqia sediminis]